MKEIEVKGKTVDEAIFNGLKELGLGIDQVEIEILHEGSKGLFGLGKSALVKLTQKQSRAGEVENFLNGLFERMNVTATCKAEENENAILGEISGDSTGMLIGRRGETLDALQYLTSLVINKGSQDYKRITLDTENYRSKREETLVRLANRLAGKVARTGRRVALEPMNPYERRILHATLQSNPDVETMSEGEEPNRRVIIVKTRKSRSER